MIARALKALPNSLALAGVLLVWSAGASWSYSEQTRYAASRGFALPDLLPIVIDGLALSLAGVAYAAALDARPAVSARLGTVLAVLASASSNSAWAWTRSDGDPGTVILAAGIPIAANLAFEVLLSELRRQVQRRRGLPAPVAIPYPRLIRVALAPISTCREWRETVLGLTNPRSTGAPEAPQNGIPLPVPTEANQGAPRPRQRPLKGTSGPRKRATTQEPTRTAPKLSAEVLGLGRDVADELARAGAALTHRGLIAAFRERGQSLSSDRASALLRELKA